VPVSAWSCPAPALAVLHHDDVQAPLDLSDAAIWKFLFIVYELPDLANEKLCPMDILCLLNSFLIVFRVFDAAGGTSVVGETWCADRHVCDACIFDKAKQDQRTSSVGPDFLSRMMDGKVLEKAFTILVFSHPSDILSNAEL
jgi:hypothetical protein